MLNQWSRNSFQECRKKKSFNIWALNSLMLSTAGHSGTVTGFRATLAFSISIIKSFDLLIGSESEGSRRKMILYKAIAFLKEPTGLQRLCFLVIRCNSIYAVACPLIKIPEFQQHLGGWVLNLQDILQGSFCCFPVLFLQCVKVNVPVLPIHWYYKAYYNLRKNQNFLGTLPFQKDIFQQ